MKREATLRDAPVAGSSWPKAKVRVPQHVVYRSFPTETVVLNLQTGKYHGLNPTAGSMLDALGQADSVRGAAIAIAREYGQPATTTERDLCDLCTALLERDLIEVDGGGPG
jgi:Coenzyme PQQ synthesis protein D (PqqD)